MGKAPTRTPIPSPTAGTSGPASAPASSPTPPPATPLPTTPHILTGNPVIDTVYTAALPPGAEVFDESGGSVTIDYYNLKAADTALAATVASDFREADINAFGRPTRPSYAPNPADFSWNAEQAYMLDGIEQVTDGIDFEKQETYDVNTVDMVFVETQAGSGLLGNGYGRAIFPNTLLPTNPHDTHAAVNGGSPDLVATTEMGAAGPRASDLGHEGVGHSIGLTHPFNRFGSAFPSGLDLDNNLYTMMSYDWATNQPGSNVPTAYGQNVTPMAIDIAAIQAQYGIATNNSGDTVYNLVDGAQIKDDPSLPAPIRGALDLNGDDTADAVMNSFAEEGLMPGLRHLGQAMAKGTFGNSEQTIGRAYAAIHDGTPFASGQSVVNNGDDTISYSGARQSALINLNSATLGAQQPGTANADADFTTLSREVLNSDRMALLDSREF